MELSDIRNAKLINDKLHQLIKNYFSENFSKNGWNYEYYQYNEDTEMVTICYSYSEVASNIEIDTIYDILFIDINKIIEFDKNDKEKRENKISRILKSNKKLIDDIDKCIDELLEGKKYHDQIVINYAYEKMEKLLVDSLQQFTAINVIIEKINN